MCPLILDQPRFMEFGWWIKYFYNPGYLPAVFLSQAAQQINTFQFSTTTVTVSVQVKSLHPPQFQRPEYEGVITAVGVMATDPTNKDEPLRILATDEDYAATGVKH